MIEFLNNLSVTSTDRVLTSMLGGLYDALQSKAANGGRDKHCKFYYNNGAGGSVLQVVAKSVIGGVVAELKDEAVNGFNSLFDKKNPKVKEPVSGWAQSIKDDYEQEKKKYGLMEFDGKTIHALDEWGYKTTEGLMLAILLDKNNKVTYNQGYYEYVDNITDSKKDEEREKKEEKYKKINKSIEINALVWYDTTAMISVNSGKNVVISRVQGRDYSRKELVSNGDIKISVTGQITSGKPDIYPASEVSKFIKMMQYKGIIKVNNQILDQFGIDRILIVDFNISSRQGYKSVQQYTFSAIGLQPEKETNIKEDTIFINKQRPDNSQEKDKNGWVKIFNNKLDGLELMSKDIFSQGAGLVTGMLENTL